MRFSDISNIATKQRAGNVRRAGRAGGILLLAAGLAACGGGGTKTATATATVPSTPSSAPGGRNAAFRQCMASHGVTMPQRQRPSTTTVPGVPAPTDVPGGQGGPGGGGGFGGGGGGFGGVGQKPAGITDAQWTAALTACRPLLPNGGQPSPQQQAFRSCMADHGVTLPAFGQPGSSATTVTTIDRSSPAYQAALKVCGPLLPQRGQGGGGGSPATTASSS